MKRMLSVPLGVLVAASLAAPCRAAGPSPYVGQEQREIKALSPDEVAALQRGEGLGLAKAAELNHYPGPKHVLELAHELNLTAEQEAATRQVFERMQYRAVSLGSQLLDLEKQLDSLFTGGQADTGGIESLTAAIGRVQGELRASHLAAHIQMRAILTSAQLGQYDSLRGYGAGAAPMDGHRHAM